MHHRVLMEKLRQKPLYLYCDIQDIAIRIAIVASEVEVWVKKRQGREYKAAYDSRLVGLALSDEPTSITQQQYNEF